MIPLFSAPAGVLLLSVYPEMFRTARGLTVNKEVCYNQQARRGIKAPDRLRSLKRLFLRLPIHKQVIL